MSNLRLPNITASTDRGQLEQIRSYLYQFAQELNWAMSTMEGTVTTAAEQVKNAAPKKKNSAEEAQATFSEIKSLIIKSADIVNVYYDEINSRLEGLYVAQSDFGTYMQKTSLDINGTPTSINMMFDNQQAIRTDVDDLNGMVQRKENYTTILGTEAWCNIGVLGHDDSGFPIYGMEIGQINEENGKRVTKKFAQYRSDGVHLFDQNGTEVATISDQILRITNAEITGYLQLGGYKIIADNGLVIKWEVINL